ncbi:MAG: hypothetical protein QOJ81_2192 [Chloroflexota bacterium]|jgi:hypothetical protein|nr:hypothetical protein [Chloroflexota bacterium]
MAQRSRQRKVAKERSRTEQLQATLEWRTRRGWLVRLAAWTGSARLVQLASRFIRIEGRPIGTKGWVELDVRPEIKRDGTINLVPVRGGR